MKYFLNSLAAFLLFLGCSKDSEEIAVADPQLPPPVQSEEPLKPKPEPTPIYACSGTGQFSKIEIWWSKSTSVTDFFLGELGKCENHSPSALEMVIRYPATGTTVQSDREQKTFWMMLKTIDESGNEHQYFQYSHFFARTSTCSQGQFLSDNGQLVEIRLNEPSERKGILLFNATEVPLSCPRT